MCAVKCNEDVLIACVEANAAELKCSEGGKGNKEVSSRNVLTSVEGVAVTEKDGHLTTSVPEVHDSGASQRDVDDVATAYQDKSAVSTFQVSLCLHYHHPHMISQLFWK